ncbi:hypothetical protein [Aestuariivirga sp.]|uniref:hypothetical protein n=1 Tax=Aestuariivirga sp. TaxID=2650926 RepID=UPI0039E666CA
MIRYTLFVLAVIGSAATAVANIAPERKVSNPANVTIVEKNQAFPQFGAIVLEECAVEDCSEE